MDVDSAVPAEVPQSEPLDDTQVPNNAGGYVNQIDDVSLLRRFIILGSNGNNYYVSQKKVTLKSTEVVLKLLTAGEGQRVVAEATEISKEGRAPRQTAGIFVLAICARLGDAPTRAAALAALPSVCRTASTLFEFVQYCKELGPVTRATRTEAAAADPAAVMAWIAQDELNNAAAAEALKASKTDGATSDAAASDAKERRAKAKIITAQLGKRGKPSWGRSFRRAISHWYLTKSPVAVAYQVTKYSQRNGWSHADLLRLAHPDPEDFAAKKRELAAKKAAEAAAAAETVAAAETATAAETASSGEPAPRRDSDAGDDWVMVPVEEEGGNEVMGGEGSEQGALAAAVAAAAAANTASVREGLMSAAEAAEVQFVADMKAIFAFLTHETIPGQEPKERRGKPKAAPPPPGAEVGTPMNAAEVPVVATEAMEEDRPTEQAAATDVASVAAATDPLTDDAPAAKEAMEEDKATDEAAATGPSTDDAPAPADAPAKPDVAAPAVPLSPVMQYIVDAHKLRKVIRAPPPLVKKPKQPRAQQQIKRRMGGRRSVASRAAPEPAVTTAPEPPAEAVAAHKAAQDAVIEAAVSLIRRHRFGHEHVGDTALLCEPQVWATFLEVGMPLTAMIRNLGRMTELSVLERPECLQAITTRLSNANALAKAHVHPMSVLDAMCTYRNGGGALGKTRWSPVADVSNALEAAFYLAFKNVEPTGKRYLLGLDVSGSMCCACSGMTAVQSREAAAAMAMTLVRTEHWVKTLAFSHELVPLDISGEEKLPDLVARVAFMPMGGTDCALPMIYATERRLPVDVFVVLTDNETWFGGVHPTTALRRYRQVMGLPDAKLVVLAFSTNGFSIADPKDPGMLDVAGLDSAVPRLVADFVTGKL